MLSFKATFRLTSTEVSLNKLTELLGEPSDSFAIGDTYSKARKKRTYNYWCRKSTLDEHIPLAEHLNQILDFVERKETEIDNLRPLCAMDIFCMLASDNGQGGAELPPELMSRAGRLGLAIGLDIHMGS